MSTEVVQGEVVDASPAPSRTASRVRDVLAEPYKGSRLRTGILKELDERMEKGDYGFTLSTIARKNGLPANGFISLLHDAFEDPNHELHDFACQMQRRWAECEEHLYGKVLKTAADKGKWEGFMTGLERTRGEDWHRPSQAAKQQTPVLNVGFIETLQLVAQRRGGELTTGD